MYCCAHKTATLTPIQHTVPNPPPHSAVCWIGVKVAVLCARQYMSWNIFLIKVLNNFWYFEHPILTMTYLEVYLKHYWRNLTWFLSASQTGSVLEPLSTYQSTRPKLLPVICSGKKWHCSRCRPRHCPTQRSRKRGILSKMQKSNVTWWIGCGGTQIFSNRLLASKLLLLYNLWRTSSRFGLLCLWRQSTM